MAKKALVVGINDYSNWNNGVTVGDLSLSAPSLQWCVGDSSSFADLLQSGFNFDQVTTGLAGHIASHPYRDHRSLELERSR
jgi:hypothetical protein